MGIPSLEYFYFTKSFAPLRVKLFFTMHVLKIMQSIFATADFTIREIKYLSSNKHGLGSQIQHDVRTSIYLLTEKCCLFSNRAKNV